MDIPLQDVEEIAGACTCRYYVVCMHVKIPCVTETYITHFTESAGACTSARLTHSLAHSLTEIPGSCQYGSQQDTDANMCTGHDGEHTVNSTWNLTAPPSHWLMPNQQPMARQQPPPPLPSSNVRHHTSVRPTHP
jgi:hypothetical protein